MKGKVNSVIMDKHNLVFGDNCSVVIPTTDFNVSLKDTHETEVSASNHDAGIRNVFLEIKGKKNIAVDFGNSEFTVGGRITPIYLSDCKNVKLKNFKIKFKNRYYLQSEIVGCTDQAVILNPCPEEKLIINNSLLTVVYDNEEMIFNGTFFAQEFEKEFKVARKSNIRIYNSENNRFEIHDGLIYLFCDDYNSFNKGNLLCLFCEPRTADCLFIDRCENVVIENVTLYSSPSMGIMCQLSRNVALKGIKVVKEKVSQYYVTTLADATHFFACRGKILIKDCVFENMNDDATNIHGIYQIVVKAEGNELITELKHRQQFGVNSYKKGDLISILDGATKSEICKTKVLSSSMIDRSTCRIIIDREIKIRVGDIVENLSANPKVEISNCVTGNNRPRGFLVASNKETVVKNCEFYNSECGIGVFADLDFWYESGATKKIKILRNKFSCNYGGGKYAVCVAPSLKQNKQFFNKKIVIKKNVFNLKFGGAVGIENTEKIVMKNNCFLNVGSGQDKVLITDCGKIKGIMQK